MAQMTQAFPERSFSGIGGIATFAHALNYFLLGCGTVQVCTAAMLDRAVGPNVIRSLVRDMSEFLEKRKDRGWKSLEDFRGLSRNRVVAQSQIARPDAAGYHGGREASEGYADPAEAHASVE
jgi:dihydroorotate dehydrogenase